MIEVPDEQLVLQLMEDLASQGRGATAIAAQLNSCGFRRRKGKPVTPTSVWETLNSNNRFNPWIRSGCSFNHLEKSANDV